MAMGGLVDDALEVLEVAESAYVELGDEAGIAYAAMLRETIETRRPPA